MPATALVLVSRLRFNTAMIRFLPVFIGLRYLRAKRRMQFISFVSGFSLLGMFLGVLALIVVLSVMNGFDRELKQRLLSVVPHGFIESPEPLQDWRALAGQIKGHPDVVDSAPYIEGFGLLGHDSGVQGVQLMGILPAAQSKISILDEHMIVGDLQRLQPGEYGIVLGSLFVRHLRLNIGDKLMLTLPQLSITPAGVFPRTKRFTLVGVFEVGAQVDQSLALIHIGDAQKLFRYGKGVQGLQLKVSEIYRAASVMDSFRRGEHLEEGNKHYTFKDWSQTQGSLFEAIKMEKRVIAALLMIIVAVAAFNIISSLVLMVADKRSDIAVLRTMGLSGRQVMAIFMVQGSAVGFVGIFLGALVGSLLAIKIDLIVAALERGLGLQIFDPNVYFITRLPSQWLFSDVLFICGTAMCLSVLATVYPAWRASQIQPAEALRYE